MDVKTGQLQKGTLMTFFLDQRLLTALRQALLVIAIIVRVGLCQPEVGQQAPSTTRTFGHLQSLFHLSTTLVSSVKPIGAPPTSCM